MASIKFRDAAERVVVTFVQAVLGYLVATSFTDSTFWQGLAVTATVAGASAVKVLLTLWVPVITNPIHDVTYRVASTFVVTFVGAYSAATWLDIVDTSTAEQAGLAAITAGLSVLKASLAAPKPNTITPASLARAV
jgi:hypothetical protein